MKIPEGLESIAVKEGKSEGKVWVGIEAKEGIDVDGERSTVGLEKPHDFDGCVADGGSEVAGGGNWVRVRGEVHVSIERYGGFYSVAYSLVVQGLLDVLQRRKRRPSVRTVVRLQKRLVPNGYISEPRGQLSNIISSKVKFKIKM